MALSTLDSDLDIIAQLDDLPNDNDGLSAAELKAKFDEAANIIKTYINETFIPELETAIANAAKGIASGEISGSVLADGSINAAKLNQTSGLEAVITNAIRDLAVTTAKIATGAVTTAKIGDRQVTSGKIAIGNVTKDELGSSAVTGPKIAAGAVVASKLNPNLRQAIQTVHKTISVKLAAGNDSWTVTATGVLPGNTVIVAPSPEDSYSSTEWSECGVRCTAQATNRLTFASEIVTENPITVNVLIFDLGGISA